MGKRLYVILIALLSFSFIFESFSISVDAAETKTSAMNNPDRQTINKMLTEIALEYNVLPEIVKAVAEKKAVGNNSNQRESHLSVMTAESELCKLRTSQVMILSD